jgi:hypothetical protein
MSSKGKKKISKSGVRTKFLIESLRNDYYALREENERLRSMVSDHLPADTARAILAECYDANAPSARVDNIDDIAAQVAGSSLDDDEDDGVY